MAPPRTPARAAWSDGKERHWLIGPKASRFHCPQMQPTRSFSPHDTVPCRVLDAARFAFIASCRTPWHAGCWTRGSKWKRRRTVGRRTRLVQTSVQPRLVCALVGNGRLHPMRSQLPAGDSDMYLADQVILKDRSQRMISSAGVTLEKVALQIVGKVADGIYTVRLGTADLDACPSAAALRTPVRRLLSRWSRTDVGFAETHPMSPFTRSSGVCTIRPVRQDCRGMWRSGVLGHMLNAPGIVIACWIRAFNFMVISNVRG